MIRIICNQVDCGVAANIGGPVQVTHKTFDVEVPELEAWLRENLGTYIDRSFVGIEILPNRVVELKAYVRELEDKLAAAEARRGRG